MSDQNNNDDIPEMNGAVDAAVDQDENAETKLDANAAETDQNAEAEADAKAKAEAEDEDAVAEEDENGDTVSPLTAAYLFSRPGLPSDPRSLPAARSSAGSTASSSEGAEGDERQHDFREALSRTTSEEVGYDVDIGGDGDRDQDGHDGHYATGYNVDHVDDENDDDDDSGENELKSPLSGANHAFLSKARRDTQSSFASLMSLGTDEDDNAGFDPRRVGMENAVFGDYDLKKSQSTQDFLLSYIDDEMARRNFPGRLSVIANESLTARRRRRRVHETGADSVPEGDEDMSDTEDAAASPGRGAAGQFGQESKSGAGTSPPTSPTAASPASPVFHDSVASPDMKTKVIGGASATPEQPAESAPSTPRHRKPESKLAAEIFGAAADVYMEGITSIVDDNFWKCFESKKPRPWNWNAYLWPMWGLGVLVRYFVLFPLRIVIFVLGWVLFGIGMFVVQTFFSKGEQRTNLEHRLIMMMCGIFCITWGAVIRYHGSYVKPKPGQCHPVYVANHTSMIDVIILQQMRCFSLVGQRHKGIVRFLQEVVLGTLQCVWFDRGEIKDRAVVAQKLKEHALDPDQNPLLVFPEGTCVNNEYIIQFKKGIFEIGVPVVPVAIKYNKLFVDPFWNSRQQSFPMHLVELMTSFCLICDVWYLKPHVRRPGESSTQFAARVKKSIADKSGLKNVNWDGYMKYWKPSARYLHARQEIIADKLRRIHLPDRGSTPGLHSGSEGPDDDQDDHSQSKTRLRKTSSM
ncbi:Glycerol-3-phosphate acyltransferase 3 [Hondaea fermentalgiana]|uniref:Glycerol-3-phosphate acyltransferase 3 n=1 Tax=Hondaea fermentalgiana TaxID=2315210 RepID=A0A2R5GVX7_9STRA|nr:Glycerol-3-phosphate acyltransferase 3 [Hondaea fermentalgiana]|eukprot:GBG34725.1 Glycerol-3-phosphate acyltransferase 3 [Hondaea fermentalgiana]